MPILDNSTQWSSTYLSLQRAIRIQRRIHLFSLDHQKDLSSDILSDDDWKQLDEIYSGLQPFHAATLRLEGSARNGHHGAIWEALPILETLLGCIEQGQNRYMASGLSGSSQKGQREHPLRIVYQNA
jgi:hypothetical protein